jgi:hypothetical protein
MGQAGLKPSHFKCIDSKLREQPDNNEAEADDAPRGAAILASAITQPCSGSLPTAWVSRPGAGAASDPRRRCGPSSRVRVGEPAGPPPG